MHCFWLVTFVIVVINREFINLCTLLQDGLPLKGVDFKNWASIRVTELSKVRAKRVVMNKTIFELAIVLPGVISETPTNGSHIFAREPRLAVASNFWIHQIKGIAITSSH